MTDKKPFREMLNDMPLAVIHETFSLTGVLERSSEADKFVVHTANGGVFNLPIDAVVDYTRIGGSIGQEIVQIELKTDQIPPETMTAMTQPTASIHARTPFVLATPHHVSGETLANMQAMSASSSRLLRTNLGDDETPVSTGTFPLGNGHWHLDQ